MVKHITIIITFALVVTCSACTISEIKRPDGTIEKTTQINSDVFYKGMSMAEALIAVGAHKYWTSSPREISEKDIEIWHFEEFNLEFIDGIITNIEPRQTNKNLSKSDPEPELDPDTDMDSSQHTEEQLEQAEEQPEDDAGQQGENNAPVKT